MKDFGSSAPFPFFGGKSKIAAEVWEIFGSVKQYIEPFCGSAAMLLSAPNPALLEVVNDVNGFIANFWRSVRWQPDEVARWADYPVSHIDLGARHGWLLDQRARIAEEMQDPEWIGDAQVAGWWLWGQCCWIGSGWCEWDKKPGQIPHVSDAGRGVQAIGQIPHVSDAGMLTSSGRTAWDWLHALSTRLERVRVVHGDWHRCLNHHYGKGNTAIFLDPPYRGYSKQYASGGCVADEVEAWALEHGSECKIVICGHVGDYPTLTDWIPVQWSRARCSYAGTSTKDLECVWFSPGCG